MSIIVYHLIYFRHLHSPDSTTICQSEDPSHTGVPVHLPVLWERVLAHDSANGHPHGEKQLQGMQQIVHLTVRLKAAKVLRWAAGAGQWSNRLCRPRTQRKKKFSCHECENSLKYHMRNQTGEKQIKLHLWERFHSECSTEQTSDYSIIC